MNQALRTLVTTIAIFIALVALLYGTYIGYHEITYKSRGYKYIVGYENSKDVIFDFYGDHYWFMGKLELVAKDNSTLWEHLKSSHHLKKTATDRMLPKLLLKHTKTNNPKEFEYFKNPHSHEISTYAYYLPAERLVYITWLGDW